MRMLMRGCQCEHDIEKVSLRKSVSGCQCEDIQCEHDIDKVSMRMSV